MTSEIGAAVLLAGVAGCASGPPRPAPTAGGERSVAAAERDGAEANPPADLVRVPDAEPKLEPIRSGGPNKPYEVWGQNYVPITQDAAYTERGPASWYGRKFHGKRTSSGEPYDMYAMTAAHPTLPIPSYVRVRNPKNGREVIVRINDRGPFHSTRIVDLSYTAALKLDLLRGVADVELQRITFDEIRTGAWRREAAPGAPTVLAAVTPAVATPVAVLDTAPVPVPGSMRSGSADAASASSSVSPSLPSSPSPPSLLLSPSTSTSTSLPAPPSLPSPSSTVAVSDAAMRLAAPDNDRQTQRVRSATTVLAAAGSEAAGGAATASIAAPSHGYWVQLGAFRARDGAERFQRQIAADAEWLAPRLAVFGDAALFRLQSGPYPTRDAARDAADRVRDGLKLVPVIVERH